MLFELFLAVWVMSERLKWVPSGRRWDGVRLPRRFVRGGKGFCVPTGRCAQIQIGTYYFEKGAPSHDDKSVLICMIYLMYLM